MEMHSLLQRQLRRSFPDDFSPPPEWGTFLNAVNNAYRDNDENLELLERSLELSSQELLQANSEMRAVIQAFPDLFFWLDQAGTIVNYQGRDSGNFYLLPEQLRGKRIQDIPLVDVAQTFQEAIHQVKDTGLISICEYSLTIQNNERFFEARLVPLLNKQIFVIIRDITERKLVEEKMRYLSLHDPNTGLYNRAYFEEEMRRLKSGRYNPVGLIICDLDGLKWVNDTLGHEAGDALLIDAATVLKESMRESDMIARIGGDEFAILLPKSERISLELAIARIREGISLYNSRSPRLNLSISIGFAIASDSSASLEGLFKKADDNMYRDKLLHRQSTSSAMLQTLMKALKARDYITEGHAVRIQNLMRDVAVSIGLSERCVADLCLLAQFHDVGKIGIADRVLLKPGSLNPEETLEMRQHCDIGYRIANSAPVLLEISDWIQKHHEWWNGQGYPLKLAGEDIPLECRILALADAYDAMTNDRPYRKAMSHQDAIAEIRKHAGSQFDPQLTPLFLEIIERNFNI
ncbi:MAG: hypothetical protein CVU90_04020 [Firmicutes bacterium HGW-Firmicutes-15]|nr:MAG: hypothetical protein CVU90_04020 [Firmicutes bacterium HGW-Firmicutes-15]